MTTKYYCDRCGKEKKGYGNLGINFPDKIPMLYIDICEECLNDFRELLYLFLPNRTKRMNEIIARENEP
jgi:hypothetical protein